MNKYLSKIVGAVASLAMVIGVGIGIASGKKVSPLHADSERIFAKITSDSSITSGSKYLIVYESSSVVGLAFNGSLATIDATSNYQEVAISSGKISTSSDFYFTITSKQGGYSIRGSGGKYIGSTANSNQLLNNNSNNYTNSISWDDENDIFLIKGESTTHLVYNGTDGQTRFRFYKDTTCSSGVGTGVYKPISLFKEISVSSIALSGTYPTSFNVGDTFSHEGMVVTATYSDSSTKNVASSATFSGYNMSSPGNQTVTVSYTLGDLTKTATYDITVSAPSKPFIAPTKDSTSGYTGQNEVVSFTYGNLDEDLSIVSSNPSIVTVETPNYDAGEGTVQLNFVGAGSTTVKFKDGETEKASLSVTVTASTVSITGLASSSSVRMGKTLDLGSTITVTPTGSFSSDVDWASGNPSIATVNGSGVVTPVSVGTVDITVASHDYPSATMTCSVTILEALNYGTLGNPLNITQAKAILDVTGAGHSEDQLFIRGVVTESTYSAKFSNYTIWLRSDDELDDHAFELYGAVIDQEIPGGDGDYTADNALAGYEIIVKGFGTIHNSTVYELTFVGEDYPTIKSLTPPPAVSPTEIVLDESSVIMGIGEELQLNASLSPLGSVGEITWESDNGSVATVDNEGNITAIGEGSTTITATVNELSDTCSVRVLLKQTLDLSTDTTASASNECLTWEAPNAFSARVDKAGASTNANNYYPGTPNKNYTSTRFYKDSVFTFVPHPKTIGVIVKFNATSNSYASVINNSESHNASKSVSENVAIVEFTDGLKQFDLTISGTCGFTSINYYYTAASAKQEIERSVSTQASLSYTNYVDNGNDTFGFTNLAIRFKGVVDKDLWAQLNTESSIEGYGILFSSGDFLGTDTIMDRYNASKTNENTVDEALAAFCDGTNIINYSNTLTRHEPALKATPSLVGDDYVWALYFAINYAQKADNFSAVAYIRINGDIVFLNEISVNAADLADDLIEGGIYEENAFGGSLKYLAGRP